jgi:uncharacterized protein YqgC (DUF456 family)
LGVARQRNARAGICCSLVAAFNSVTLLLWMLGVALVLIGFVGIVMPALPGHILIFAGLLLAAWADHFTRVAPWTLAVIGIIGATSYAVDFMAAAVGVKRLGASRRAMIGATLGTLAGLVFGLPGIVVGPFVGALLGELTVQRDWRRAGCAGIAAWIGFAIGTAVKAALAFVMVGIFIAALLL